MSKRKRSHHHDSSGEGFRKWISGIVSRVKPRRRHTLSEGIRLMTPEEEAAAIEAAWSPRERAPEVFTPEPVDNPAVADAAQPREREVVKEVPAPEPFDEPADAVIAPQYAASKIPTATHSEHRRHQYRKRKPKRRWHLFGRRKNKAPVSIETTLLKPLQAENAAKELKTYRVYIKPTINSTALFVLAYLIVWLTYQFAVMVQASFSNIDSVLYYYEIMFPIGNYSMLWSQFNIILITAAGPFISVVLGVIYYYVFLGRTSLGKQIRQLLVWLYLISMAFFFGAFVAGAVTHQGFGYVADWLYMHIVFRIGISMIFLFLLGFLGWKTIQHLPDVSGSDSFKRSRTAFVLSRLSIPWLAGGALMIWLKRTPVMPQHPNILDYDMIIIGSMIFPVVAAIFNKRERPRFCRNSRRSTSTRTIVVWVTAALILASLVRIGLSNGLYFQFRILLDIKMYH